MLTKEIFCIKIAALVTATFFILSCGRKTTATNTPKKREALKFTELIADNISEDITGEDELYLMILTVKKDTLDSIKVEEWSNYYHFFKDSIRTEKIYYQLPLKNESLEQTSLYVFLLEIDTIRTAGEIASTIKAVLSEEKYIYSDSLSTKIKLVMKDDDLLGLSHYKLSGLAKNDNGIIVFTGINLFDKYYYRLKYYWE